MAGTSIEILNEVLSLFETNIKKELTKPYQVKAYNGLNKTIGGNSVMSPSVSNTGNLMNQLEVKFDMSDDGIALFVDFGSAENYAWFVEYGRQAGKGVPPGVLDKWISQRGIGRFRDRKGRFITNKARSIMINRSIKQHGYSGRYFLKKAIDSSLDQIYEQFGDFAYQRVLEYLETAGVIGTFLENKEQQRFQQRIL